MANAELIITPEVSASSLKKSMKEIDDNIKKVADNSEKYLSNAMEKAGKSGGIKFASKLKLGIAGAVAMIAGAVIAVSSKAGERAGMAEGVISDFLGESSATTNVNLAKSQGMSNLQLSMLMNRNKMAGGDDDTMRDFITDTSDFISQAKNGQNSLLSNFVGLKGADQFNAVLASLSSLAKKSGKGGKDTDSFDNFLANIGWAGDASEIINMISALNGKTGKDAFKQLSTPTSIDRTQSSQMIRQSELEIKYKNMMRSVEISNKTGLLNSLSGNTLEQYKKGLIFKSNDEITAVLNYSKNKKIALEVDKTKRTVDAMMLTILTFITVRLIPYIEKFISSNNTWGKVVKHTKNKIEVLGQNLSKKMNIHARNY